MARARTLSAGDLVWNALRKRPWSRLRRHASLDAPATTRSHEVRLYAISRPNFDEGRAGHSRARTCVRPRRTTAVSKCRQDSARAEGGVDSNLGHARLVVEAALRMQLDRAVGLQEHELGPVVGENLPHAVEAALRLARPLGVATAPRRPTRRRRVPETAPSLRPCSAQTSSTAARGRSSARGACTRPWRQCGSRPACTAAASSRRGTQSPAAARCARANLSRPRVRACVHVRGRSADRSCGRARRADVASVLRRRFAATTRAPHRGAGPPPRAPAS